MGCGLGRLPTLFVLCCCFRRFCVLLDCVTICLLLLCRLLGFVVYVWFGLVLFGGLRCGWFVWVW